MNPVELGLSVHASSLLLPSAEEPCQRLALIALSIPAPRKNAGCIQGAPRYASFYHYRFRGHEKAGRAFTVRRPRARDAELAPVSRPTVLEVRDR